MARKKRVDVGDETQVKTRKKSAKLIKDIETEELYQILQTPGGRAFCWRILAKCGIFRTSMTDSANHVFFNEGQRNIGLWLIEEINNTDKKAYAIMSDEAVDREETRKGK